MHTFTRLFTILANLTLLGLLLLSPAVPASAEPAGYHHLYSVGASGAPGRFLEAMRLAVAPDGTVYVMDWTTQIVQHFTAEGQFLDAWTERGSGDAQTGGMTMGIAFAGDGSMFVIDVSNNRLHHLTAEGSFLGEVGSVGSGEGQFQGPFAAAGGPDGNVYVVDRGNARVQVFNPDGQFLRAWTGPGLDIGYGIAVGQAPAEPIDVYVATESDVQHFTGDGAYLGTIGASSYYPSVAVGPLGEVYVADCSHIVRYHRSGILEAVVRSGTPWGCIHDIQMAPDGTLYVATGWQFARLDNTGQLLGAWGTYGPAEGGTLGAFGVGIGPDDSVYVVQQGMIGPRVNHFAKSGQFLGRLDAPFGYVYNAIGVAADGTVYVGADGTVRAFDAGGAFLSAWQANVGYGTTGLDVGPDDTLYIVGGTGALYQYSRSGTLLGEWHGSDASDDQFGSVMDVAVASDGTLFVADAYPPSGSSRIVHMSAAGQLLGQWGGLDFPWAVSVGPDGQVFVADGSIKRFTPEGEFLGTCSGGWGVDVASDGTVFVASESGLRAYGTSYPETWRGEYFSLPTQFGAQALIRDDEVIDFDWGAGAPAADMPADGFSARWTRDMYFEEGPHHLTLVADDAIRLRIDRLLIVDQQAPSEEQTYERDVTLNAGYHRVTLTYTDRGGTARVKLSFAEDANDPPSVDPVVAPLEPIAVQTEVTASAPFSDPDSADMHTALWEWGDGATSAGEVNEQGGAGTASGSHAYDAAGVYPVTLTVTDDRGASTSTTYQSIVAYDPTGGFVTGAGWIDSPAGSYRADPTLVGKATFGFVSKYLKGTNIPTGNAQFRFAVADLGFRSTSYQWLVVAGTRAQFKGVGTINGAGEFGFLLTAIDGQLKGGGGSDKFRIKIWDRATQALVYDNQSDAPDGADPTTAIGAGSIVIHKEK